VHPDGLILKLFDPLLILPFPHSTLLASSELPFPKSMLGFQVHTPAMLLPENQDHVFRNFQHKIRLPYSRMLNLVLHWHMLCHVNRTIWVHMCTVSIDNSMWCKSSRSHIFTLLKKAEMIMINRVIFPSALHCHTIYNHIDVILEG
jgi:hypothetical protein